MRPLSIFASSAPIFCFVGGVIAASESSSSVIGKSYHLYHTLGHGSKPSPRGTISIAPPEDGGGLIATFFPEDSEQLDVAAFDGMVEKNGLYTLIVTEDGENIPSASNLSSGNTNHVSASVPGCSVRRSNMREEITLSISPTGKLMSVSYRPLISPLAPNSCDKLKPLSEKPEIIFGRKDEKETASMPFKTTVAFESHKPMMAIPTVLPQSRPPPGLKWYKRNNSKGNPNPALGDAGEEQPSAFKSSFLYRYWYIILPLAIAGLFGGEEPAGGEQGGQSKPGGAASTGAAAVGAATAGGVRQRRGKRD